MTDHKELIAEAKNYEGDNGTARWPSLITDLADALEAADKAITWGDEKIGRLTTEAAQPRQIDREAIAEAIYATLDGKYSMTWPWARRCAAAVIAHLAATPVEGEDEWGVKRDECTPQPSRETAEYTIERQRKHKLNSKLVRRTVGPWEEVTP